MDAQLTRRGSGITVVSEHVPGVRSVTLGMWIAVGSRDESPEQSGCSHFLEHLLFKGTSTRSARAIAEALDAVGGELNAFTSKEVTCFHARVLDRDLPLAFEVLADLLVDARNTPEDVEAERQVVLSELDIHHDTPDDLVHTDFARAVLREHPLAAETLGSLASIEQLDRDTIDAYYREHYRPGNVVVAAAGNLGHDRLVALADALLGDLGRPGGSAPRREPPGRFGRGEVILRSRPTEQAHVVLGVPGLAQTDDDRWALRVLDTLLGGGMSSRLFQVIREEQGLAYATYSYASSYTDGGLLGAYVGTAPAKVDEVLRLLRRELDRVADDVTSAEVDRARGALTGGMVLSGEDTGARMARLGRQVATGMPIIGIEEALERVGAVTRSDVQRVARRLLTQPRDLAVVGPFDPGDRERFAPVVQVGD